MGDALQDLPAGTPGEILSRGPELFVGYRDSALDVDAFLPGRWFRTGDIGVLDPDGYLTITDRRKDLIIRGGENLSSKLIEDILAEHEAVAEARSWQHRILSTESGYALSSCCGPQPRCRSTTFMRISPSPASHGT